MSGTTHLSQQQDFDPIPETLMPTRQIFRTIACCLILLPNLNFAQQEKSRPNVLLIAADDLGNVLGPNKPRILQTPNFDRLMSRGVYFEQAYCQIPLCNPSRASLMTGRRPDVTSVYDLDRHFREQIPDVITLPQMFKQHGWYSARVGKIYHYDVPKGIGTNGLDDPLSWGEVINPRGRDVFDEALITNPTPERPVSAAMSWLTAQGTDEEQTDGLIATEGIRLLREHQEEPFFLAVGFFRPHTPYVAPKKYFDRYPLKNIELVHVPDGDRDDIPPTAIPHNIPIANYGLPAETLTEALRAYYACITFLDAQVGRLLDALDESGVADNTIVVFWSDHGYHLGEHGLWQKRTLFTESARAPLIIAVPHGTSAGTICRRVVEFVDIYPTLAELAGIAPPADLDGRSLKPLLDDPDQEWNHPAFTQILRPGTEDMVMGRVLTTDRWRYIEWNGGVEGLELYDRAADPQELTNLAKDRNFQSTIDLLSRQVQMFNQSVRGTPPETPVHRARL